MSNLKGNVYESAIESDDEEIPQVSGLAPAAPGPFNRSRGSRGSSGGKHSRTTSTASSADRTMSNSSNPGGGYVMRRRESNVNVDNIHEQPSINDISPAQLYLTDSGHLFHAGKLCVILVGLPARGKTHHSVALTRYLRWLGVKTHAFHLGDYRRKCLNQMGPDFVVPDDYFTPTPKLQSTIDFRERVLSNCMTDILTFLNQEGGQVAIYDAVNATAKHRKRLVEEYFKPKNIGVLFVECIATDDRLVARNVRDVKLSSPDYQGVDYKDAVRNYLKRIELGIPNYETMGSQADENEQHLSYVKLINGTKQIKLNKAPLGYLQNRIVFFLMNTHVKSGSYFFARAGQGGLEGAEGKEEEKTPTGKFVELCYRDDTKLSSVGHEYAKKLRDTLLHHLEERRNARSGASTLGTSTPTELGPTPNIDSVVSERERPDGTKMAKEGSLTEESIQKRLAQAKLHSEASGTSTPNSLGGGGTATPHTNKYDAYTTPTPTTSRAWTTNPILTHDHSLAKLVVWSSKRIRTIETGQYFADAGYTTVSRPELTQLNPGAADGLTDEEILKEYPEEFEAHKENPYHHRYPRAESYHDVAVRLEPLIMEMERFEGNLLIIAHESVLCVLYGYLMACTVNDIPFLKFPKNEIVEITPGAYYNSATRIPIPNVDP